jgi:site-specific recombinase XerD
MAFLLYSSGIRVGEMVRLRVADLDAERHASPATTQIYTHVTRRDLVRIRSPLDMLDGLP